MGEVSGEFVLPDRDDRNDDCGASLWGDVFELHAECFDFLRLCMVLWRHAGADPFHHSGEGAVGGVVYGGVAASAVRYRADELSRRDGDGASELPAFLFANDRVAAGEGGAGGPAIGGVSNGNGRNRTDAALLLPCLQTNRCGVSPADIPRGTRRERLLRGSSPEGHRRATGITPC